jgi:hypothetical protein
VGPIPFPFPFPKIWFLNQILGKFLNQILGKFLNQILGPRSWSHSLSQNLVFKPRPKKRSFLGMGPTSFFGKQKGNGKEYGSFSKEKRNSYRKSFFEFCFSEDNKNRMPFKRKQGFHLSVFFRDS